MFVSILSVVVRLSAVLFLLFVTVMCASVVVLPFFSSLVFAMPDVVLAVCGAAVFSVLAARVAFSVVRDLA